MMVILLIGEVLLGVGLLLCWLMVREVARRSSSDSWRPY